MASAVDSRLAYARLSAVATASRLPTANRGSNNSYTTSWDTTLVVDRGVDGGEFLQGLDVSEPRHRPFPPSKRLMRVFRPVVEPTAAGPGGRIAYHSHRSPVGRKPVRDERSRADRSASLHVCGRPLQCKRDLNNFVTCGSGTIVCSAPVKRHACAAGPYGVRGSDPDRFSGMLDSPARDAGFSDPVSPTFCPYVVFRPNRTNRGYPRITPSRACPRSPAFQCQTAFLFQAAIP